MLKFKDKEITTISEVCQLIRNGECRFLDDYDYDGVEFLSLELGNYKVDYKIGDHSRVDKIKVTQDIISTIPDKVFKSCDSVDTLCNYVRLCCELYDFCFPKLQAEEWCEYEITLNSKIEDDTYILKISGDICDSLIDYEKVQEIKNKLTEEL